MLPTNTLLDKIIAGMFFTLLIPCALIVASWNSLPGSRLFAVKTTMEQMLLFVSPTVEAKGTLQIAYTERRFSEASRMLADQASVEGLEYLDNQVNATTATIKNTKDPAVRKQLAQKYIATLQTVNVQLEQQKQMIATTQRNEEGDGQQDAILYEDERSVMSPTRQPARPDTTPVPTVSAPATGPLQEEETVAEEITNTQDAIDEAIAEVEELASAQGEDGGGSGIEEMGAAAGQETGGNKDEKDKDRDKGKDDEDKDDNRNRDGRDQNDEEGHGDDNRGGR